MDKLEKHIKNQLRNREISPSPEAWGRIAKELGSEKNTSPKSTYWWAIAAGVIGLIMLSIGFFGTENTVEIPSGTIVVKGDNKEETPEISEEEGAMINPVKPQKELVLEVPLTEQLEPEPENFDKTIQVAQNEAPSNKEPFKDVAEVTDLAITNKLEEVLAQVNSMEENSIAVSDKEIDSLLMAAQKELLVQKTLGDNGKVDAMALLEEVELELYDDERNPLFIKLKEGFFRLRTAVADRDN